MPNGKTHQQEDSSILSYNRHQASSLTDRTIVSSPEKPSATSSTAPALDLSTSVNQNTLNDTGSRYVQVAVPRPLHGLYDYRIPPDQPTPDLGARVEVPFGRNTVIGICVKHIDTSDYPNLKEIYRTLDPTPIIPAALLCLAQWLSTYYHHPIGDVLTTMLPSGARSAQDLKKVMKRFLTTSQTEFELDQKLTPTRQALLNAIRAQSPVEWSHLREEGYKRPILNHLLESKQVVWTEAQEASYTEINARWPTPTEHQAKAIERVGTAKGFNCFLLDGVTGSGKTEIYLQCIRQAIQFGGQALVLVPEISLTPQTKERFSERFNSVTALHSAMTDTERLSAWLDCLAGRAQVVIGTRSAVFAPLPNIKLIVVDEEHDSSYKQQDGFRYSARDIAIKRASDMNVPVILGSATPALESILNARRGKFTELKLPVRAGGAELPEWKVIDMKKQIHDNGISMALKQAIGHHLTAGNQVLVFLNRRGYAPTILCSKCGWQAECAHCDARLTAHLNPSRLICHHCTTTIPLPKHCPKCESTELTDLGFGTQKTEQTLTRLFPQTPVFRIDRDTIRSSSALEASLEKIKMGGAAILVGTQMLAKGHHFPDVTLVGILNVDTGFLSPDFRAPERAAQMVTQVAGRAGRAEKPGEVWLQSWQPDNPALTRLMRDNYAAFADRELTERCMAKMPPAFPTAIIRADALEQADGHTLLESAKAQLTGIEILGPVPAPIQRIKHRIRWQMMLIGETRASLHAALARLKLEPSNRKVRWSIDVDPYDSF